MPPQLFYRIEGQGDPIVLLHGFLASSHYFKQLRRRLATTHTVISIDLLGFGRSPKPRATYTYDDHLAAIEATLAELRVSHFALVGHSLGALLALRYAIARPKRVSRLVLLNPPLYKGPEQALATLQATGLHYRVMFHSPLRDMFWYTAKLAPRFPFNKRRPAINMTDVLRASKYARQGTYQHVILRALFFKDISRLVTPALLVVGRYDRPIYHQNLAAWSLPKNVCGISVVTGHHLPIKSPALAERLIRSHLSDY
jgi:pimeloyl-ACP methyl ester carboxylesterase